MQATPSPPPALPVAPGNGLESGRLVIHQTFSGALRRISIAKPSMYIVRQGHKTVTVKGRTLQVAPGEALVLGAGCLVDRVNLPGREWRIGTLAARLAMSEPTLRRRLAEAGTSATEIIADVHLTAALTLLQTSSVPITQIASEVGYLSPSWFAARFRARFGISPAQIRGRQSRIERNGT